MLLSASSTPPASPPTCAESSNLLIPSSSSSSREKHKSEPEPHQPDQELLLDSSYDIDDCQFHSQRKKPSCCSISRRRSPILTLSLLILFIVTFIVTLVSLVFFVGITHSIIPPPPALPKLKSFDPTHLKHSATTFSKEIITWLDSVPTALYSSTTTLSTNRPNPLNSRLAYLFHAPHPILPLLLSARSSWKQTIQSQPTSLQQARDHYVKRYYPLKPPPGFDQWYHFSQNKNFTLIDRFDSLMSDLMPFRNVTPQELNRRTLELSKITGIVLLTINNTGGVQLGSSTSLTPAGPTIKSIIEAIISETDWRPPIPIDLAINQHSGPKILPHQARPISGPEFDFLTQSQRILYESLDPEEKPSLDGFKPEWGQDGNVWDTYRRACPPDSPARRWVETLRGAESKTGAITAGGGLSDSKHRLSSSFHSTRKKVSHLSGNNPPIPSRNEMTFLSELESRQSFCERPSNHHLHSAFFNDDRSIPHLYPLFSASKPPGFFDILIPSHYHHSPTADITYESDLKRGLTTTPADLDWDKKKNKIYWHGKLTRGANTPAGHMSSFQKQRLVKLVSNDTSELSAMLSSQAHRTGETDPSGRSSIDRILVWLNTTSASLESMSESATVVDPLLLDIAIACDPKAGECQNYNKQGYYTKTPEPLSENWKNKMVLDLDDAAFSNRFPALMESKSAVVKMSIHQEFWRDWIQPWYHFIPLSSSYSELHNLVTFFVGIPDELKRNLMPIEPPEEMRSPPSIKITKSEKNQVKKGDGAEEEQIDADAGLQGFEADEELRKIGENGRDWKSRHLRKEDMEVYVFRLLIEWARMLDLSVHMNETMDETLSSNHRSRRQ